MSTIEVWKDIPGYEGIYMVSNTGKIKKLRYIGGILVGEKLRKPRLNKGFYTLSLTKNHKRYPVYIHVLVAKLFIPNPLNLHVVIHLDGDKSNNNVENLKWVPSRPPLEKGCRLLKAFRSLNTIFSNMSKEEYFDYHTEIETLFEELLQYKFNIENGH